jgi:hypothetical protein
MSEVTVLYRAHITHKPSGKTAVYEDSFTHDTWGDCLHAMKWAWTEGNYGCDCNRSLFFERSLKDGEESPLPEHYEATCSEGLFAVSHLDTEDGIIILIDSER